MRRVAEYDAIRGIAVLLVLGYHFLVPGFEFGFLGVDIFFVLSGYLITSILVNEWKKTEGINLPKFYLRRVLCLFPALIILLVAVSLVEPPKSILATLFYFENWATAFHWLPTAHSVLIHTWSLSIEEQFYLLWPVTLFLLLRSRIAREKLFLVALALALASSVTRAILWSAGAWSERLYRGTDTHTDGIFLGSALALLLAYRVAIPRAWVWTGAALSGVYLVAVLTGMVSGDTLFMGGFSLIAIGVAVLVGFFAGGSRKWPLHADKPLVLVGQASYGVYLWHLPIYMFLGKTFRVPHSVLAISALILTLAIAGASYRLVEQPILRMKDRLAGPRNIPISAPTN